MSQTALAETVMESFVIEGGRPLNGRVRAAGNKNGALPILAACLLTAEPVTLTNVPRIRDVETMVELLDDLGAEVEWTGRNELRVRAAPRRRAHARVRRARRSSHRRQRLRPPDGGAPRRGDLPRRGQRERDGEL